MTRMVTGRTSMSRRCARFWLRTRPPNQGVAGRQLNASVDLFDRFFHGASQIPAAHAVLHRDVARIRFAMSISEPPSETLTFVNWASETRSPAGEGSRIFSMASRVSRNSGK